MTVNVYATNVSVSPGFNGTVDLSFDVRDGIDVISEVLNSMSDNQKEEVRELLDE